jgi:hypothetical protein
MEKITQLPHPCFNVNEPNKNDGQFQKGKGKVNPRTGNKGQEGEQR